MFDTPKNEDKLYQGKHPEQFFLDVLEPLRNRPREQTYSLSFSEANMRARFKLEIQTMYEYSDTVAANREAHAAIFWKGNRVAFAMEVFPSPRMDREYTIAIYSTFPGTLVSHYKNISARPYLHRLISQCVSLKESMKLDFDPYNQGQTTE